MFMANDTKRQLNFVFMSGVKANLETRLRERLEKTGISQAELARTMGIDPPNITNWMKRGSIPAKPLLEVSRILGCRPDWLLNGSLPMEPGTNEASGRYSSMHIHPYDEGEIFDPERYAELKVVDAELSAGDGFKNGDLLFEDKPLPFLRSTLKASGVREDKALVVRIIGNSMEPVLSSGDTVGVNLGDKSPIKDGKPYAIRDIDMIRVKLLYQRPGGGLRIRSYNIDEYPDEDLTAEQVAERITMIGRVFWSSRMW
jgi:phage repressor protein C with HTH and peptisase S24 domain